MTAGIHIVGGDLEALSASVGGVCDGLWGLDVAGAVGGFMLAGAVVCAVIALVLGPPWLLGTGGLAVGGAMAVHLAGDWLGHP